MIRPLLPLSSLAMPAIGVNCSIGMDQSCGRIPLLEARKGKAFVVAAPTSGSGKTLITLALLRAFRNAGMTVRSAKVGPDYIDPGFHAAASGAPCFNLDLWAMGKDTCRALLSQLGREADLVIVEGVMGLFDGPQGAPGSTADLAAALGLPVVLVIDCAHQAQSIAALVHGFAKFRNDVPIAGLILNRVKSDRHESLLREALSSAPPVFAVMRQSDSVHLPSRHLGLVQAQENQQLEALIESAVSGVTRETILDNLFRIGTEITNHTAGPSFPPPSQRIAVAHDQAFGFAYPHLLSDWKNQGAEISTFSPLNDEAPEATAGFLFLPGGYPELHAGKLAANSHFLAGVRQFTGTIYGECGGYMVLGHGLTDADGTRHTMAGLLPVETSFAKRKLHLGYRQLQSLCGPFPKHLRGHEFHYSTAETFGAAEPLFSARSRRRRSTRCHWPARRPRHGFLCPHHRRRGMTAQKMKAKAIMFMGTGSDVGKSLIVAGLARAFARQGLKVAPFKPQNMSNNAAVTIDGGEIGRAQALQARAAGIKPSVHMNPVLLKPESETGAQVIVQGQRIATLKARDYFDRRMEFLPAILDSFEQLCTKYDLVLVEGAGSPAETNLRIGDLANFGFAGAVHVPAVLVGDIHRGGVIASIVGTHAVLDDVDRSLMKAFLINKFHGDPNLFDEGRREIERRCAMPCLGVIPHFAAASHLPAEDAVALDAATSSKRDGLKIAVLRLPRIANFDDLDPLRAEPGVSLSFVQPGEVIAGDTDLVIVPGSKSTIADLRALRYNGWDIDIAAHVRRGGRVLGLCGGYQMLGRHIHDPLGLEGNAGTCDGLGLLDVETTLLPDKTVTETSGTHVATGTPLAAYEIHLGKTTGPDCAQPFAQTGNDADGASSRDGCVMGTYLHGCFVSDAFRKAFITLSGGQGSTLAYDQLVDKTLDDLADHLARHVNLAMILDLATVPKISR